MRAEDIGYRERMDLAIEELCLTLVKVGVVIPDNTSDSEIVEIATNKFDLLFQTLMELCASNMQAKTLIKIALKH